MREYDTISKKCEKYTYRLFKSRQTGSWNCIRLLTSTPSRNSSLYHRKDKSLACRSVPARSAMRGKKNDSKWKFSKTGISS